MTIHIQDIPLSKLVASSANVRRTGSTARVEELAASIQAHGLLQNLTVKSGDKGRFEVIAGGRRLAALKLLAKQKVWAKDAPIACHVVEEGENVTEVSLAENALQEPMHPADQYEAFAALIADGMNADDIAARFGVSANIVAQRLKLAAVSPKLIQLYRDGEMNLEQLSAFCITDDHARQEEVWEGLGSDSDRQDILRALGEGQIMADDRLAIFVGAEAYQAAGGHILRDLFDEDGAILTDNALVMQLAQAKLEAAAQTVRAEGWKWVNVMMQIDYGMTSALRRVYPETSELTDEQQAKLDQLEAEFEAADDTETIARLQAQIVAAEGEEHFTPEQYAIGGVLVAIDHRGELRIERGFVRPEDMPKREKGEAATPSGTKPKREDGLSDALVADLTAHRTAALQNELALHSGTTLAATVFTLAADLFLQWERPSCLGIGIVQTGLQRHAADIDASRAMQEIEARRAMWAERLPGEAAALWDYVQAMSLEDQIALLAHCVSLSLDLVETKGEARSEAKKHFGAKLTVALGLRMTDYWTPTVTSYFGRVNRNQITATVREAISPDAANDLSKLSKADMAKRAEKLLAGNNWLPEVLR